MYLCLFALKNNFKIFSKEIRHFQLLVIIQHCRLFHQLMHQKKFEIIGKRIVRKKMVFMVVINAIKHLENKAL